MASHVDFFSLLYRYHVNFEAISKSMCCGFSRPSKLLSRSLFSDIMGAPVNNWDCQLYHNGSRIETHRIVIPFDNCARACFVSFFRKISIKFSTFTNCHYSKQSAHNFSFYLKTKLWFVQIVIFALSDAQNRCTTNMLPIYLNHFATFAKIQILSPKCICQLKRTFINALGYVRTNYRVSAYCSAGKC